MNLRPLAALVRKDLLIFFHDRRAVILSFAVPLVLASFFAVVFAGAAGGPSGEAPRLVVGVADLDESRLSRELVASISVDESWIVVEGAAAVLRERVRKGTVSVAILIPKGFGESAPRVVNAPGARPTLTLLHDPTRVAELGIVRGLLTRHLLEVVVAEVFRRPGEAGRGGSSLPFEMKAEAVSVGDPEASLAPVAHAFGGMAVQFLLFSAIESGIGLLTERQKGLWRRIRSAPVSKATLLLGRAVGATLIALMILAVIFTFGAIAFRLRVVGSPIGFALVCLGTATTAASIGLVIASLGRTPQAARGLSAMVVLILVMLGGAWVPTFVFPAWLRSATRFIPTRWAVDGFDATLGRGASFAETLPIILALFGFTVAFAALAVVRFRWEES